MTLMPERGPNACTPQPRISLRRQDGFVTIVFQEVFPAARSASMTSRISRNSSSIRSGEEFPRSRVRTTLASSCLSFSISQRGDSSRNQMPVIRIRPGIFWKARGNLPRIDQYVSLISLRGETLHANSEEEKEQPYPSHWATRKPQLNIHWSNPERVARHFGSDNSAAYIGIVAVSIPTAIPAMKRPIISIAIFTEPACNAQPRQEITEPVRIVRFRPNQSAQTMFTIVPRIAPPWNAETIPLVTVSLGLVKYSWNVGSEIVEVIIPLS